MYPIYISGREINQNQPCFIIAEAGVNHNGDINLAKKLVDVARDAGVDAVKFQTFNAEDVVIDKLVLADYQKNNALVQKSQVEMLRTYELDNSVFIELKEYCDEKGIIFLSTPHSEEAVEFLEPLVPAYKVGSGDLTNLPLLEKAAKKGKPLIIGTGMSTLEEVKKAYNKLSKLNKQIIMLHCTTNYPCPLENVNLRAMITMRNELDCLVGYSDHTLGLAVPIIAASLGAVVIEKHFTLDRGMSGPDHKASLEPDELKSMVASIRDVEIALGDSIKSPTEGEKEIMRFVRKSIVARKNLPLGTKLTWGLLTAKRPGNGISPEKFNAVIGKKLIKNVEKDEQINLSDLE